MDKYKYETRKLGQTNNAYIITQWKVFFNAYLDDNTLIQLF